MPFRAAGRHTVRLATVTVAVAAVAFSGCTSSDDSEPSADSRDDGDARRELLVGLEADVAANPTIPGEVVAVVTPNLDIAVATGFADVEAEAPLKPDTQFRVASMTKTFVAAAILRLVEDGAIGLDDPIGGYLTPESLEVLRLDGYDPERITVRQLLLHTGGLFDYATTDAYEAAAVSDPSHRWTRLEQLQFATEHGDPVGEPGAVYNYSDTGYVLLGEIIEQTTDQTLPAAVRELLDFEGLGLAATYWEVLEPTPTDVSPRAHQYFGTLDNIVLDASTDLYGGGGLVSTVTDLARFYRALFAGEVFDDPETLDTMTTVSVPGREEDAAMGIYVVDVVGERCYGHRGFWGTQTIHCPDLDLTFARTTNQADDVTFESDPLERVIVRITEDAQAA